MRRRDFLLGGGAIVASVRAVLAQQPEQLRRIALLGDTPSDWAPWTVAFVGRLRELGWSEGFKIAIDYRWSEARPERLAEIVAELVKHKPDVIVTYGGAVSILKKATASIPIVFAIAVDPLGVGLGWADLRIAQLVAFSADSVLRHYRPTSLADRLRRTGDCGRWRRAAEELDEAPQVLSGCGQ